MLILNYIQSMYINDFAIPSIPWVLIYLYNVFCTIYVYIYIYIYIYTHIYTYIYTYIYIYICMCRYMYISKVGLRRNYLHKYDTLRRAVTISWWSLSIKLEPSQLHGKIVLSWRKNVSPRLETKLLKLNILTWLDS